MPAIGDSARKPASTFWGELAASSLSAFTIAGCLGGVLVSKPNGAKIACIFIIHNSLRLLTAVSLVRISLRVMAWRRATLSVTLRLAAIACLAAWYCSWDKA